MRWMFGVLRILSIKSLILITASLTIMFGILMVVTGYIQALYRFYEDLAYPPMLKGKLVIVFSSYALAPFTSVIDVKAVEQVLEGVQGVEKVFYQVVVLGYISKEAIVVRGVAPNDFRYYTEYKVVEGIDLIDDCFYCIWVGSELSKRLQLKLDDTIAIYSPFTSTPLIVKIVGVIDADYPYNYEIIASLSLARVLRGIDSRDRYASLAIVVLSSRQSYEELAKKLDIDVEKLSLMERAVITLKHIGKKVEFKVFSELAELYMSRLGISRDVCLALLSTVTFILSIGSYIIGQAIAVLNADGITVLYEQGISKQQIKISLCITLILQMILALILAKAIIEHVSMYTQISIINYKLAPYISEELLIAIASYILLFILIGLITVRIYDET